MGTLFLLVILNTVISIRNFKHKNPIISFCCLLMSIFLLISMTEFNQWNYSTLTSSHSVWLLLQFNRKKSHSFSFIFYYRFCKFSITYSLYQQPLMKITTEQLNKALEEAFGEIWIVNYWHDEYNFIILKHMNW